MPDRVLGACHLLAAVACVGLAVGPFVGLRCAACSGGLIAVLLPWLGLVFYGSLAFAAIRFPGSSLLLLAPGFYLFVHAALITEMFLIHHPCPGCIAVAAAALAGGAVVVRRNPREWPPFAVALVLGAAAAMFTPLDRVDDSVTRKLWPARIFDSAPSWIPRENISRCDHPAALRLALFEKDCKG